MMIKSIPIYECQYKSTRVNTNQHESNTSQHESTRVRHESTRINTSPIRIITNQHKSDTSHENQHESLKPRDYIVYRNFSW